MPVTLIGTVAVAIGLAAAVSFVAYRAGALRRSGAVAATAIGAAAMVAGWRWGVLLVVYFVATSALSRWRADEKAQGTGSVLAGGVRRNGIQVAANGAVFALAALGSVVAPALLEWAALGAGALAASAADSWGTEIGTLSPRPRSLRGWQVVPPGTSGAISLAGSLASVAGAAFVGVVTITVDWPVDTAAAVIVGGIAGALADSVLGATIQARRWCVRCKRATEQRVHRCGSPTRHVRGIAAFDNDAVNLAATLVGAAVAAAL